MSGLGLLATAFGSYASTLGGLYKEQVEKEQAAQEKLAAEERQRAWEREKIAGERQFTIEMLQRKFDLNVKLAEKEHELQAKLEATKHQQDLERIGYARELELKEQEQLKHKGVGDMDSREFAAIAKALTDRAKYIGEMVNNANEEERQRWLDLYNAAQRDLDYFIRYRKLPEGSSFGKGSFFVDPEVIVNSLANE